MKTNTKIFCAKIIFKILMILGFKKNTQITKSKIKWSLDISEGIDLSIFIFGSFQKKLILSILKFIKKERNKFDYFNIIDVGSNIGDKSLSLTKKLLDNGISNFKVFSIEPTDYAFDKQIKNIQLNPKLEKKILNYKMFISSKKKNISKVFSSWKLDSNNDQHNKHGGTLKMINKNTEIISLDEFIKKNEIKEKIIIKIDVDGYEIDVINSLKETLTKMSPIIFMEYAPYALVEHGYSVDELYIFLKKFDYEIYDLKFNKLNKINISDGSSKDIVLIRDKQI